MSIEGECINKLMNDAREEGRQESSSQIKQLERELAEARKENKDLEFTLQNRTSVMDNNIKFLKTVEASRDKFKAALERIVNDKEFSHDVKGNPVRACWYIEEAKRALSERGEK